MDSIARIHSIPAANLGRRLRAVAAAVIASSLLLALDAHAVCGDFGLAEGSEVADLVTPFGSICIELLRVDAPVTVGNFLAYLNRGDFSNTIIHRSVPGFVIQGGGYRSVGNSLVVVPTDPPINVEPCSADINLGGGNFICSSRGNDYGTIAMARTSSLVSATNQWFINVADNRGSPNFLDTSGGGFTVFGKVLGTTMNVAESIVALATKNSGKTYWLNPNLASALSETPVLNPVPLLNDPFGCFNPHDLAIVVDPANDFTALPDPETGESLFPLSGGCGTQIPRGSFDPVPVSPCSVDNLLTMAVNDPASLSLIQDPATSDWKQYAFDCNQATQAKAERALWRDDYQTRLTNELVVIQSATVHTVPEPSTVAFLSAGGAFLWILNRRKGLPSSGLP